MRHVILLVVLLAAAGGLGFLLLQGGDDGARDLEFEDVGTGGEDLRRDAPEAPTMREVAEVVGAENWALVTEGDEIARLDSDMRLSRRFYEREGVDDSWNPSGAQVLEILGRHGREDLKIKFRTQADLEAFRAGRWPIPIPPQAPIHILLDTAVEIGFQPIQRADAIYMKRIEKDEPE